MTYPRLQKEFYVPETEEAFAKKLEKRRRGKLGLDFRRVEFSYIENKFRGKYKICSMRVGITSKYKLARSANFPWTELTNPPSMAIFEYAKDDYYEYFRMLVGSKQTNIFKIKKP